MTSSGISYSWWYRPTYVQHPWIDLARQFGKSFEVALKALQENDVASKCKCSWCGMPLSLCEQAVESPDGGFYFKCCANSPDYVSWYKYDAELWIRAQEESNPVQAVWSEKIEWA